MDRALQYSTDKDIRTVQNSTDKDVRTMHQSTDMDVRTVQYITDKDVCTVQYSTDKKELIHYAQNVECVHYNNFSGHTYITVHIFAAGPIKKRPNPYPDMKLMPSAQFWCTIYWHYIGPAALCAKGLSIVTTVYYCEGWPS